MVFFNNNFDTRDIIAIALVLGIIAFGAFGIENEMTKSIITLGGPVILYYFKTIDDERRENKQ